MPYVKEDGLLYNEGNSGSLLSDRHINTDDAGILLVDNGIDSYGRFTGTAVADDQLTPVSYTHLGLWIGQ